jgi:Ni/Fe-hydrogenase 1 B-type cytochrome subunit
VGHNALAGVTYLVMFTLMLVEIITGLTLYTQVRGGWSFGFLFAWLPRLIDIQYLRLIHFCIMFVFFAFVIHHVYSAVLVSWEERNGLVESIFTGYKFIPRNELEEGRPLSKENSE